MNLVVQLSSNRGIFSSNSGAWFVRKSITNQFTSHNHRTPRCNTTWNHSPSESIELRQHSAILYWDIDPKRRVACDTARAFPQSTKSAGDWEIFILVTMKLFFCGSHVFFGGTKHSDPGIPTNVGEISIYHGEIQIGKRNHMDRIPGRHHNVLQISPKLSILRNNHNYQKHSNKSPTRSKMGKGEVISRLQ